MIDPPVETLKIIIQLMVRLSPRRHPVVGPPKDVFLMRVIDSQVDDPTVDCRWSSIKCFVNGVSENVPQVNVQLIVLTCLS